MVLDLLKAFKIDIWSELGHEVVSGGCPTGPDAAAKRIDKHIGVVYTEFPAQWETHGRSAGPKRNRQMAEYGNCLLLIWDGKSPGSRNMRSEMKKLNKPIFEVILFTDPV